MEGKDNRSKDKRHKMKTHYRNKSKFCATSSSSGQMEVVRGYVDIVDSSDERFVDRNDWIKGGPNVNAKKTYPVDMHDLPIENEENEQMQAGDFHMMSQLPTAMGGHFKFSSEKQWEQGEAEEFLDNHEASEYFTLNLKLLNVGLQTVPFYKRMDYASTMFSKEQLVVMETEAEQAEKLYQSVLKEHIENPKIKIKSASQKTNSARSQKTIKSKSPEGAPDELDELLNMTSDQMSNISVKSGANTPVLNPVQISAADSSAGADDIQQWLDNVLDE